MSLKSMTGFARSSGSRGNDTWHWELRTVNGRSLEVRLRVPPGLESLETPVRELCAKRLGRGNCNITLAWERSASGTQIRLNEQALKDVTAAIEVAQGLCKAAPPTLDGILGIRGVLEVVEASESEADAEARNAKMLADLETALGQLIAARRREGERLEKVLGEQVAETARLTALLDTAPQRTPEHVMGRLKDAVARLRQAGPDLDSDRLHQEAMLIATRIDISEEIARLKSPCRRGRGVAQGQGTRRAQARFPRPGIQPRGEHDLLEGERCRVDAHRPRPEGRHRSTARAGAEH